MRALFAGAAVLLMCVAGCRKQVPPTVTLRTDVRNGHTLQVHHYDARFGMQTVIGVAELRGNRLAREAFLQWVEALRPTPGPRPGSFRVGSAIAFVELAGTRTYVDFDLNRETALCRIDGSYFVHDRDLFDAAMAYMVAPRARQSVPGSTSAKAVATTQPVAPAEESDASPTRRVIPATQPVVPPPEDGL